MQILYCRVGWMNSYRGNSTERPQGGGKYNKDNIGFEVHNYLGYEGKYYGFVEPGVGASIHVERFNNDRKSECAEGILVVWVAKKPSGGQYIIGWYKNAVVFRKLQDVPAEVMTIRDLKTHNQYNIYSEDVFLLDVADRNFKVDGVGQKNIWYGEENIDKQVISYIENYGKGYEERIEIINAGLQNIVGGEKDSIVKVRINQDKFRAGLIKKYKGKCCLCGVSNEAFLIASHIKPWAKSDNHEKFDLENGLLLCPNHDKLFDGGYISFDEKGKIIISQMLDQTNCIFMNISENMGIEVTEDNSDYLKYHREHVLM